LRFPACPPPPHFLRSSLSSQTPTAAFPPVRFPLRPLPTYFKFPSPLFSALFFFLSREGAFSGLLLIPFFFQAVPVRGFLCLFGLLAWFLPLLCSNQTVPFLPGLLPTLLRGDLGWSASDLSLSGPWFGNSRLLYFPPFFSALSSLIFFFFVWPGVSGFPCSFPFIPHIRGVSCVTGCDGLSLLDPTLWTPGSASSGPSFSLWLTVLLLCCVPVLPHSLVFEYIGRTSLLSNGFVFSSQGYKLPPRLRFPRADSPHRHVLPWYFLSAFGPFGSTTARSPPFTIRLSPGRTYFCLFGVFEGGLRFSFSSFLLFF